ncbi:MAG: hypothetical protein H7145_05180 [Akkermansiaceae bacterium]|nr:hypothetical protein [Armatimonadota bacterium]
MSTKAILRLLIGCAIAALILVFLLPAIGIPKSYLLPPAVIYGSAKGKTNAFVTEKKIGAHPNPFKSTESVYYVTYRYRVTPPVTLLEKPTEEEKKKKKVYLGRASVPESLYTTLKNPDPAKKDDPTNAKKPETVPIRFEQTRPDISGITQGGDYLNDQKGGALFGSWLLFFGGIFLLGYIIAPLLQLVILREDF